MYLMENEHERAEKSIFLSSILFCCLLLFKLQPEEELDGAHRRAVMWFQCLRPCGIVPSGGKPLRLGWHITAPIINSRSVLSFLLHLSSFLLTEPFFCFACTLIITPGSFTSTYPQHFLYNLLSQQSHSHHHAHQNTEQLSHHRINLLYSGPSQDLTGKHFSKWKYIGLCR